MNKILNGKILKRHTKKFKRFKGFKNKGIIINCDKTTTFKFIYIFILIIFIYNIFTNNLVIKHFSILSIITK